VRVGGATAGAALSTANPSRSPTQVLPRVWPQRLTGFPNAAVSQALKRLEDRRGRDREPQRTWSSAVRMLNV
jgi:hypothetical protein